jgi:hypothetical protein
MEQDQSFFSSVNLSPVIDLGSQAPSARNAQTGWTSDGKMLIDVKRHFLHPRRPIQRLTDFCRHATAANGLLHNQTSLSRLNCDNIDLFVLNAGGFSCGKGGQGLDLAGGS